MSERQPSQDLFVVRPDDRNDRRAIEDRVREIASVESLPGHEDLLLLRIRDLGSKPKDTWTRLHDALGDLHVAPAILDERGAVSYPTGRVAVRFKHAPKSNDLERFADKRNLKLVTVNKYVAEQAVFEPQGSGAYLPDVVKSVEADADVDTAWAESLSGYKRGV
jgi:hypothetical protein